MNTQLQILAIGASVAIAFMLHSERGQAEAPSSRYTITASTVYDTATALTWQRAAAASPKSWDNANSYCASLNLDAGGWRLPSVKELLTIVDETRKAPAIDPVAFPSSPPEYFWTSSTMAGDGATAWYVNFAAGVSSTETKALSFDVRCVR